MVHCNYKETTGSYSLITERLLPHSLPNVDIICNMFIWNFEEACDMKNCDSYIPDQQTHQNFKITQKLHCMHTVITQ